MKNLIIIADYCSDSLTTQELLSSLRGHLNQPLISEVSFVSSTPNTIHTAFLTKQILTTEERLGDPNNLVVFVNTDSRLQTMKGIEQAQGAEFVVARLANGAFVCGPNAGHSFSLISNEIEYLYLYSGLDKGTQFRSRELYMPICALLMNEKQDEMELLEIRKDIIPTLDKNYIGHIDNYGNLKTTISNSFMKGKYEFGEKVGVIIGNSEKEAYYVNNMFAKEPGVLVIAPGSSGPKADPYLELIVREYFPLNSARIFFPSVKPGDKVAIK